MTKVATLQPAIEPYSSTDVRHLLENQLTQTLTADLKFKESTALEDRHLALGFLSVVFAAYGGLYGYIHSFQASQEVVGVCVAAYVFISGLLTLSDKFSKQDIVFVGKKKDPLGMDPLQTLIVRAVLPKYSSEYTISVQVSWNPSATSSGGPLSGGKKKGVKMTSGTAGIKKSSLTKSVGAWIDEDGFFSRDALLADLKRLIDTKTE